MRDLHKRGEEEEQGRWGEGVVEKVYTCICHLCIKGVAAVALACIHDARLWDCFKTRDLLNTDGPFFTTLSTETASYFGFSFNLRASSHE